MKRPGLIALFCGMAFSAGAYAHDLPVGASSLDAEFLVDWYKHTLQDGMTVETAEDNALNKIYGYTHGVSTRPNAESDIGEVLFLSAATRPNQNLYADGKIALLGNYADRFWRPINDLHRMEASGEKLRFVQGEAQWRNSQAHLRVFQGKSFDDWQTKGDLFGFLQRQDETERYLNFSGHGAPRAAEGHWQTDLGELGFIAGPEVVWGARRSFYGRYNVTRNNFNYAVIYKDERPPFTPDEKEDRKAIEVTMTTDFYGRMGLKAGLMYQPFRLDEPFQRAEKVNHGQGTFGSSYEIIEDKASEEDAWGATFQMTHFPTPFLDRFDWGYTYLAPVAGNKHELFTGLSRSLTRTLVGGLRYAHRQPVIGPMPLIYEGTPENPGALLASPRGPDDPFWVNWENRKAHVVRLTFVEDPTPNTWLFRWDPHILEPYNINPNEDAAWSYAMQYRLDYYPTATDRMYYYDTNGNVQWEPAYTGGAWGTRRPLHSGVLLMNTVRRPVNNLLIVQAGESLATSSLSYTKRTDKNKPLTTFFKIQDELSWGPYKFSALYAWNDWGPEEFQRRFGQTFDRLFQLAAQRTFWKSTTLGVSYIRAREEDNKFLADTLGGYDEWRFFFSHRFGLWARFADPPAPRALPVKTSQAQVAGKPFWIQVSASQDTLVLDENAAPMAFSLATADDAKVSRWFLEIRDEATNTVARSFSGHEIRPVVEWDGNDEEGRPVAQGIYHVNFGVQRSGEMLKSDERVRVVRPQEIKMVEVAEGLRLSLTSHVLFATGQHALKPAARAQLDQVVSLLKTYPDNRVRVEGHTDSTGSPARNKELSLKRAQSVADLLMKQGNLPADRFEVLGRGQEKPVASNSTAAGREANRRVEITILKDNKP